MALVSGYSSASDEDETISTPSIPTQTSNRPGPSKSIHAAPEVSLEVFTPQKLRQTNKLGSNAIKTNANQTFRQTTLIQYFL